MATSTNNFKLDVTDALGFKYSAHKQACTALALGSPKVYYELKSIVYLELRDKIITQLYDHVYSILSTGKMTGGAAIGSATLGSPRLGDGKLIPSFPMQQCSSIAIEMCKDMNKHIDIIMQILLPDKNDLISKESISIKGISDALES